MIKDLQSENAELRLNTINAAPAQGIANPMAPDDEERLIQGVETTQGLDIEDGDDNPVGGVVTTTSDTNELKIMQAEIERLHKEKIIFARNTADEILKLNKIIKVLSNQYTTLSTPYYKKFNPVDSIIRSLGYTPNSGGPKP